MRRVFMAVVLLAATAAQGAVFEKFLSPERPADGAILSYLELDRQGKASSVDLTQLAVLLLDRGFAGDARDYLRKAIKLDGGNYEAIYRLGLVYQRQGEDGKAARQYRRVLRARPGFAPARFMLALAEERRGHRHRAIEHYVRAYQHAPELAVAEVNPLVLDSRLQAEVQLARYPRQVRAATFKLRQIEPAEIELMQKVNAERKAP